MSRERAFSFSWGNSETAGAEAGVEAGTGTRASRIVFRIFCKSFLKYLGIFVVATEVTATESFIPKGSACYLDNLLPDLGSGEESGRVTERAMKGRSRREHLRPRTEVILVQTFF